jgi:hypothetical protein
MLFCKSSDYLIFIGINWRFLKKKTVGGSSQEKVTITKKLEGQSLHLTNTIRGKLEKQLEDRLVQMHPNSSDRRIQAIISQTAEIVSGQLPLADE